MSKNLWWKGENEIKKWCENELGISFRNENDSNGYKWIFKLISEINFSSKIKVKVN